MEESEIVQVIALGFILLLGAIMAGIIHIPAPQQGGGTTGGLDQHPTGTYTANAAFASGTIDFRLAQTFTPSMTGKLEKVRFFLTGMDGNGECPIRMKIYATSGGLPTGAALGTSAMVTFLRVDSGWKEWDFSMVNVNLNAGTMYAAQIERVNGYCGGNILASQPLDGNDYLGGSAIQDGLIISSDLQFETYMQ